jgi:hypothetical protein
MNINKPPGAIHENWYKKLILLLLLKKAKNVAN